MNRGNWYLWVGVFLFLTVIARYAYLAAHPNPCAGLISTDYACEALRSASPDLRARLGLR